MCEADRADNIDNYWLELWQCEKCATLNSMKNEKCSHCGYVFIYK